MREECPHGLKPDLLGLEMSEVKAPDRPAYSAIHKIFSGNPTIDPSTCGLGGGSREWVVRG